MEWISFVEKNNLNYIESLNFGTVEEIFVDHYSDNSYDVIMSGYSKDLIKNLVVKKDRTMCYNINKEKSIFDTKEKALRNLFWRIFK
jgi:hypothetical protein